MEMMMKIKVEYFEVDEDADLWRLATPKHPGLPIPMRQAQNKSHICKKWSK